MQTGTKAGLLIEAEWSNMASMNMVIISSGNGLLPIWHQAITWTNADLLIIGPLGTNLIEIWMKIQNISISKMHWKMLSENVNHFVQTPIC